MKASTFTFKDHVDVEIFVYKWTPDSGSGKAVVQIAHGLAEHAARYEHVAKSLTDAGYIVYADDHRGHGKTAKTKDKLGQLNPDGWAGVIKDLKQLTDIIKKENSGLPVFLVAHSWGSLLAQDYISQFGSEIKGVVLSGTNGKQPWIIRKLGPILAKREAKKIGHDTPSPFLDKMTFGAFNKPYEPAPTKFEWLSRVREEVDKYVNDPLCGFISTAGMAVELANGVGHISDPTVQAKIPKNLPVFIISGSRDPSNGMGKGAQALYNIYSQIGIKDNTIMIYPDARHEIFNEINKDEVKKDVIDWLNSHL